MRGLLCVGFILGAALASAQVPTISGITTSDLQHNSVRICFTASPNTSWVQVQVGTVSGTYTTQSSPNYQFNDTSATKACFSIGGLADSTTYYLRPTAQPNQTNTTNICNVVGCGAAEQTIITSSAVIPVAPTAPTAYSVPNPDTSAYTIVRMIAGATSANECKAFATAGPVTAGDTVQAVLNEIGYSTVLEFDQGITCPVLGASSGTNKGGYTLPHKASPGGNYIVIRTKSASASDFPPFGTRTSPALAAKAATFKATVQPTGGCFTCNGQTFESDDTGGSQNYILQNVILEVDPTISTGTWGPLVNFGNNNASEQASDNTVLERVVLLGPSNVAVGIDYAVKFSAIHAALVNSYIKQIWDPFRFSVGWFGEPGGTGPYTVDNNYIECACMSIYQESDEAFHNPANDVTATHNTLYWPAALINGNTFPLRQQVEFKGAHRVLIQGNLIDGCYTYQNECPAVFVSGTNNYTAGDGDSDVYVNYNLIRNAATVFDCMGVRPADNIAGPMNTVNQRVWVSSNWAYNLGIANHVAPSAGSIGGAGNGYLWLRPGCEDVTVTQNTLGFTDPHDTRSGAGGLIPFIYELGGGATLASGFTHTNNIEYMNVSAAGNYNGGRILADQPEMNTSFPALPQYTFNGSGGTNTPASILNSYSVTTTNGSVMASVKWSGNVNICGQEDPGTNNVWSDLTSGGCTTWQSGMPSTGGGDTWATGNTIAAREASVGFTPATGICTGCGGAGANIATLYTTMELVTGISVTPASSSIAFSYTAPDTRACRVDTSTDNFATWTPTADAGGASPRTPTVSGLSGSTLYYYRILCYFSQTSTLFSGDQITDGTTTTTTAGGGGGVISGPGVIAGPALIH